MKQLSEREEGYIKGLLDCGTKYRDIQEKFSEKYKRKLSLDTISRISRHSKKIKRENNDFRKCTTEKEDRIILKVIRQNRWASWHEIKVLLETDYDLNISAHTVKRRAYDNGIFAYPAKKKFLLTKKNMKKRMNFAKTYKSKSESFWDSVIFADETKINLKNPDCGLIYVKGHKKSVMKKPECMKMTVKHGGGNVKL